MTLRTAYFESSSADERSDGVRVPRSLPGSSGRFGSRLTGVTDPLPAPTKVFTRRGPLFRLLGRVPEALGVFG